MLQNLSVTKRVALGVSVPLFGLVVLGLIASWEAYKNYRTHQFLVYVSETINELTALNHKLQVERGLTAIYIGSDFQNKKADLEQARNDTNIEKNKLHEVLLHIKQTDNQDLQKELTVLEQEIADLAGVRDQIDNGQLDFKSAMTHYTKTISHIIEIGFHASKKAKDGELAMETISLLDLAEAKEYAGQERGLMAGLLSKGTITTDDLVKIEKNIGKQETLLANFIHNQPIRNQKTYIAKLAAVDMSVVDKYRKEIVLAASDGHQVTLSSSDWFNAASERIDGLRDIELHAASEIEHHSKAITRGYFAEAVMVGVVSLVIGLLSIILSIMLARSISHCLHQTTSDMMKLAEGDIEITNAQLGRNTEFGQMAEAMETFKANEIKKRELEAEAQEEQTRSEHQRRKQEAEERDNKAKVDVVVQSLGNALKRLADGNLTQGISTEYAHEFNQLKTDFENSIHTLSSVMGDISATSTDIEDNSRELKNASDDLARRTEQQAAALQQTSAAIEQITATVKQSAERASEASEKAATAKNSTEQSSAVVNDAVNAMERIEKASDEISQIITVIDDIAFQTNLLALNAGVEAARAGDAGKGFAVVAQEVRELAQRSADAAKEIKTLITNSGAEVANGVSLVKATGDALSSINQQVLEIDTHIQSIAQATAEQSDGLMDVNKSVSEMDQVTQRNAAMVEETNAVTVNLGEEAQLLSKLVGQFKTERSSNEHHRTTQKAGRAASRVSASASTSTSTSAPTSASGKNASGSGAADPMARKPATMSHGKPSATLAKKEPRQTEQDKQQRRKIEPAHKGHQPVASPAKSMVKQVAKSMSLGTSGHNHAAAVVDAQNPQNWDEF